MAAERLRAAVIGGGLGGALGGEELRPPTLGVEGGVNQR